MLNNLDAYKQIYYLEKLCREYTFKYTSSDNLPENLKNKFRKEAEKNGESNFEYRTLLDYSHIGELFDFLKSKKFTNIKQNDLISIDIGNLINLRNDIMHARTIDKSESLQIEEQCENFVNKLNDEDFKRKWNIFISNDIKNYKIPISYILYPFGKSFTKLIGREQEIKNLKEGLKRPFPISVIGHGGLGKTALVMQLIEDFMYSPLKPFENIFLFSFKDSEYIFGEFRKIDKIIQNYNDVIIKLAEFFNIETHLDNFEEKVWEKFFNTKSLLILDNLETEIVHSNLDEFVNLAQRFLNHYYKDSRLVITSRSGLGNNETKLTLNPFSLTETKELVEINFVGNVDMKISQTDWDWIQSYTKGNPGLINAFSYLISSTSKSMQNLRIEYDSRYTEESIRLHEQQEAFINFCFENTLETLPKISKEYLATICYICSATNIYEINEGFLSYVKDRIFSKDKLNKFLDINNFTNIGFLQPVKNTGKYRVNEFFVSYLDGNTGTIDSVINVFDLKKSDYNQKISELIDEINQTQFTENLDVEKLMSEIFMKKFDETKDASYAMKAFFSSPDLRKLIKIYSSLNTYRIIENRNLIDKVYEFKNPRYEKNKQELVIDLLINAFFDVNNQILQKKNTPIKQSDLVSYFYELENKISILKNYELPIKLKSKICRFLNNCSQYEKVIEISKIEDKMSDELLTAYNKLLSTCKDDVEAKKLIAKCQNIILTRSKFCRDKSLYSFNLYLLRFYQKSQNYFSMDKPLKETKKLEIKTHNNSIFALKFEIELISLEYLLHTGQPRHIIEEQIDIIQNLKEDSMYNQLYNNKKIKFDNTFDILKDMISQTL